MLANFLLYLPTRVDSYQGIPKVVFGATGREVTFAAPSGNMVHGYYFQKSGAQRTVLLHHGQGGNLATHFGMAKTMLQAGFSVLIYDYEGFGVSAGSPSNENMLHDGEAAWEFLTKTKGIAPSSIIQCGVSLGTGVASHLAQQHPCAAVVLISPYTSINEVSVDRIALFRCYPKFLFPQPDMGSRAFVSSNTTVPLLLIHGERDAIINVHHARELDKLAHANHKLIVVPNAHHGDFSTAFLAKQTQQFIAGL